MITTTPFEQDMLAQPDALRTLATAPVPTGLGGVAGRSWGRTVFTGMGSSHFVSLPSWRALAAAGRAAWTVDTGQLLDVPELLTPDTLLVITSQSGASGEVVELLHRFGRGAARPGAVIGITADEASPLADGADVVVPLRCGPEATVSTKSYLNSLLAQAQVVAAATGGDQAAIAADAHRIADVVARQLQSSAVQEIAAAALAHDRPRLAAVGKGAAAATSQFAGLITKESAKLAIEGYVGGQFRHGPFELAGPGLTLFVYGATATTVDPQTEQLARDVLATGADVVLVGDVDLPGATTVPAPATTELEGLMTGAVAAQLLAVDLARANDTVPGAFAFGSKITTAL
ncbi:SIS domain-containing protein [Kineococcus rhizosphaerae]|uniref:Glutamine--fructose-6-phosphate aminotransferase [isomerizing] n=1 Tax=Kineococcus rhizosphaerae TaxID=559628 RepID=A0A2T0QXF7_9ACTN|nr:SIS domain-containing protein [Kineococcus rhizosphaerae]PRY10568.1 glucosamine--fructose-6-phosphate aminotransferase (isomerizing) [Kineococcus rhizosphaerae]